jgi:hypothetical protein
MTRIGEKPAHIIATFCDQFAAHQLPSFAIIVLEELFGPHSCFKNNAGTGCHDMEI